MVLGKALQNLGRSAFGNVVKCVLCIRSPETLKAVSSLAGQEGEPTGEVKAAIKDVSDLEKDLLARTKKSLKGEAVSSFRDLKGDVGGHGYIAIEMQYNPNTLRLDTTAGEQLSYSRSADSTQLKKYNAPASTTLSCDFLFDNVNNMDAFMLNDNPVTGMTISNLANTGISLFKGKNFSVQRQMEGLFSMLTIPQAQHVIFFWGNMSFRGEVTQIDMQYTMFNKKGNPVRGILRMQIRQGDGSDGAQGIEKYYKYDETYWQNAFDMCFSKDLAGSQGGFDAASKWMNNSMLNLKL